MAWFPDLSRRVLQPELMDDPALDAREHARALAGLRLVNRASRTCAALWRPIAALQRERGRPLRVLDVATGSGDVPRALNRRARSAARALAGDAPVVVDGCDVSERAIQIALAPPDVGARFFVLDALRDRMPDGYDVIMCALFMHHLVRAEAVTLLARMRAAATEMVIVSDLVRCRRGYLLALLASRAFSRSRVVHVDALRSVCAAFTPGEMHAMAGEAGLRGATIRRCWPSRMLLEWRRR